MPRHLPVPTHRAAAHRSRGFGLLQVLLMISVVAGLAAIGYLQWRERSAVDSSRQERQALAQADQAIIAFATVERRLPCPDVNRDGEEDCGAPADQKGWLPSVTLRLAGADPGVDVGQLRYLVQRQGGTNDLSLLTDAWRPLEYGGTPANFSQMRTYSQPALFTLTDLCQRIETARGTPMAATLASVNSAPARATAYALAHPGINDADGNGDVFDGANDNRAANANWLEDPARRPGLGPNSYNDLVLERSFASLLTAFHCRPLIDSINTVALGHDVSVHVAAMQADNIRFARRAVAFAALAATITGLELVLTAIEGASEIANGATHLGICVGSLGIIATSCAAFPMHFAAAALAFAGVMPAHIAAFVLNVEAAIAANKALDIADRDAVAADFQCPKIDSDLADKMKAAFDKQKTDAAADVANIKAAIASKEAALVLAISEREAAKKNLLDVLRRNNPAYTSSSLDGQIILIQDAATTWADASLKFEVSKSVVTQYTDEIKHWNDEIKKYQDMQADAAGSITRLNAEIAALDQQIIAQQQLIDATNPADPLMNAMKEELKRLNGVRTGKNAELSLAKNGGAMTSAIASAVDSRDKAQVKLDAAILDRNAKEIAFNNAQADYQAKIQRFVGTNLNTLTYTLTGPGGTVSACTQFGACAIQVNAIDIRDALIRLFGSAYGTAPSTTASFLAADRLQREINALKDRLAKAEAWQAEIIAQADKMKNLVDNPASCTFTRTGGVNPMAPSHADNILYRVDQKGGTR
ncbi:hypothetical protein [Acidovorax sp. A1169]|uniref:hypothetical protein n=1 Tax=Acidovorax sp. A1169 TaxID=3059524 RepID=UPI002737EFD6|nr:hypothetical protein [Acidovorax sp. A1169]MDP4077919.1 hypothetical protein [Acidovorax sp. A1169]